MKFGDEFRRRGAQMRRERDPDNQVPENVPVPREYGPSRFEQTKPPRAPVRAITIKGQQLRDSLRNGHQLDWSDLHERYVDLWQEARMVIWRGKHYKPGLKQWDEAKQKHIQTYIADDRLVLMAIDTTKNILDSLIKIRREAGHDATGIPRWAIERIERALRDYPEAQHALLKDLVSENEKQADKDE